MRRTEYERPTLLRIDANAAEQVAKFDSTGEGTDTDGDGNMVGKGEKPFTVAS